MFLAIAACHVEVAKCLRDYEERAGGDKDRISSREHETRPYCRAYLLKDLRQFAHWSEKTINREDADKDEDPAELGGEDTVFIHRDFTVTKDMWHGENVLFEAVTPEWEEFCRTALGFSIPDDFDLVPAPNAAQTREEA